MSNRFWFRTGELIVIVALALLPARLVSAWQRDDDAREASRRFDEGFILSRNPDFSTDDREFSREDVLYMLVWTDRVNFNRIERAEWKLKHGGIEVRGALINHFDQTYTAFYELSELPADEVAWEWRVNLRDERGRRFEPRANISVAPPPGETPMLPAKTIAFDLLGIHDPDSDSYNGDCIGCHGTRADEVALDGVTPAAHGGEMLRFFGQGNERCIACHPTGPDFLTQSRGGLRRQVDIEQTYCTACHGSAEDLPFYIPGGPGDAMSGQTVYLATGCSSCHGPDGSGGPEEDIRGEGISDLVKHAGLGFDHPGGSFPWLTRTDFADMAAFLAE